MSNLRLTWVMSSECPLFKVELLDPSDWLCTSLSDLKPWVFTDDTELRRSISRARDSMVLAGLVRSAAVGKLLLEADFCNKFWLVDGDSMSATSWNPYRKISWIVRSFTLLFASRWSNRSSSYETWLVLWSIRGFGTGHHVRFLKRSWSGFVWIGCMGGGA